VTRPRRPHRARNPKPRHLEHKDINSRGATRAWARMVARVVREEPACWLRLPGCTVRSQTADHIYPLKFRPDLGMVRGNLRGACNKCNRARRDTPVSQLSQLRASMEQKRRSPTALRFFG
jgi:5-methylcytosine-specific restriction endonuclease McrA